MSVIVREEGLLWVQKVEKVSFESLQIAARAQRSSELDDVLKACKALKEGEALKLPRSGDMVRFRQRVIEYLKRHGIKDVMVYRLADGVAVVREVPVKGGK